MKNIRLLNLFCRATCYRSQWLALWCTMALGIFSGLFSGALRAEYPLAADEYIVFYHHDSLGSPVLASDANGEVLWYEENDPFGRSRGRITSEGQRLNRDPLDLVEEEGRSRPGYTGHARDGASALIYMQARHYDPDLGRFLSNDPVGVEPGNPHSFNRYAYANNNPYAYIDPDGRWAEDIFIGVPSVGIGAYSFGSNVWNGNWGSAAVDLGGIVADVGAIFTPGVPGVAGLGIKAGRVADAASAADKASDVSGGGKTLYHYTDEAGAAGIEKSGAILPDAKGRVFVTEDKVSASEASNALFMGRGGKKGTHRVEIQPNQGMDLSSGSQPNELIHNGSIRNGRQGSLEVKENDF